MENNDPLIYLLVHWLAADDFPIAGSLLFVNDHKSKKRVCKSSSQWEVVSLCLVCRLNTAMFHWSLSSAATKEVQGPDTT
jgi:hypothetical protein